MTKPPIHPGIALYVVVRHGTFGMSKHRLAKLLGVNNSYMNKVCSGESRITPRLAIRIGKLLNCKPETWLKRQMQYDLYHARQETQLIHIEPIKLAQFIRYDDLGDHL